MQNCSSGHAKAESPKSAEGLIPATTAFQPALVLLVEPRGNMQSPKDLLGTDNRYCVIDVNQIREMTDLRDEDISAAVLSVSLGWPVVRDAAISVRRQWPTAGILLQGCARLDFDDYLYESAVDPAMDPSGFMHALNAIVNSKAEPHKDAAQGRVPIQRSSDEAHLRNPIHIPLSMRKVRRTCANPLCRTMLSYLNNKPHCFGCHQRNLMKLSGTPARTSSAPSTLR